MTYSQLFFAAYAFGVLVLLVASVFVLREHRRRSLSLAIVGFAWLYAASLVNSISAANRQILMAREAFSIGSPDVVSWFAGLFLFTYLGFCVFMFYREMRPRPRQQHGQQ